MPPPAISGDRRGLSGKAGGWPWGLHVGWLGGSCKAVSATGPEQQRRLFEGKRLFVGRHGSHTALQLSASHHHKWFRRHYFAQEVHAFRSRLLVFYLGYIYQCADLSPSWLIPRAGPSKPRWTRGTTRSHLCILLCFPLDQVGDIPDPQHAGEGGFN